MALGAPLTAMGVDFDGDARIDLWGSAADVVGSVANYLARHDWQPGGRTIVPAAIADEHRDAVLRRLDGGTSERRPLDAWAGDGVGPAVRDRRRDIRPFPTHGPANDGMPATSASLPAHPRSMTSPEHIGSRVPAECCSLGLSVQELFLDDRNRNR